MQRKLSNKNATTPGLIVKTGRGVFSMIKGIISLAIVQTKIIRQHKYCRRDRTILRQNLSRQGELTAKKGEPFLQLIN